MTDKLKKATNNFEQRRCRLKTFKVFFVLLLVCVFLFGLIVPALIEINANNYNGRFSKETLEDIGYTLREGSVYQDVLYYQYEHFFFVGGPFMTWEESSWESWDTSGIDQLLGHSFFYKMGGKTSLFILITLFLVFLMKLLVGNATRFKPSILLPHILICAFFSFAFMGLMTDGGAWFVNDVLKCNFTPQIVQTILLFILCFSLAFIPISKWPAIIITYIATGISLLYLTVTIEYRHYFYKLLPQLLSEGSKTYAYNATAICYNSLAYFFVLICIVVSVLSSSVKSFFKLKVALITGNGFDIALGLPTGYRGYKESTFWPFPDQPSSNDLGQYLNEKAKDESSWFDIEDLLGKYGLAQVGSSKEKSIMDRKEYDNLVDRFCAYLKNMEENRSITTPSLAYSLLDCINSSVPLFSIFTFNYTNLRKFVEEKGMRLSAPIEHVHGSVSENNIILGVGDYIKGIPSNYGFLFKSTNPQFNENYHIDRLFDYDVLLFYGHSLSTIDYVYFQDLFTKLSDNDYPKTFLSTSRGALKKKRKYIRIITLNEGSKLSILENIRKMNSEVTRIVHNSDFKVLTTTGSSPEAIADPVAIANDIAELEDPFVFRIKRVFSKKRTS